MNIVAQASDVTKPLGAAREIVKAGNRIVLDEDSSYIENKTTKKKIPITRKNGMFMVTMRIPDKGPSKEESQYSVMAADDKPSFHRQVKNLTSRSQEKP